MALPKETTVYCGHEYTQANARFALTIEPENEALQKRAKEVDRPARRRQADAADHHRHRARDQPVPAPARAPRSRSGSAWRASPSGRSSARSASARTAAERSRCGERSAAAAIDAAFVTIRRRHHPPARSRAASRGRALSARRSAIRPRPASGRAASTAIYFLLRAGEVSRWHRVDAAEVWHWYAGAPLALTIADDSGPRDASGSARISPPASGRRRWCRPDAWQQAESLGAFTLVGCTVAPGFRVRGLRAGAAGLRAGLSGHGGRLPIVQAVHRYAQPLIHCVTPNIWR